MPRPSLAQTLLRRGSPAHLREDALRASGPGV